MGRVNGKVAIVTGAARGMGAAHARRLIEEGAKVILTDVQERLGEETAAAFGDNALFLHHDVVSEPQWQSVVARAEERFGPVSVLVNNAGIIYYGPIETTPEAEFRRLIDVNQISVFLGMKSVLPSMKRAGGGSIINIASNAGIVGFVNASAYTSAKFAVRGMTKTAAIEFAPYNIRVNSIHPGIIRTPLVEPTPETEEFFQRVIRSAPAARLGEPDEIANAVVWLASDETPFATGAEFVIDGGYSAQ